MSSVVPNPAVHLLYSQEVNRLLPGGRTEARVYASFNVGADGPFSVEVVSEGFTADALWTAINAKADELARIRATK
jgi:hypothetical protein